MSEPPCDILPEPDTVYGHVRTRLGWVTVCGTYNAQNNWAVCQLRPGHKESHAAIVDGILWQWMDPGAKP